MEIKENGQKKLLLSILGVAILVIAVIGISFAIYQTTFDQATANSIKTGTITVSYTEPSNAIDIEDAMPMSEKTALETLKTSNKTFDFTVTTKASGELTVPYEISITKVSGSSTLDEQYVRVYLEKNNGPVTLIGENAVQKEGLYSNLISNLKDSTKRQDGTKLLYSTSDTFDSENSTAINTTYKLIMWLDENYQMDNETQTKTYKAKVNVDSAVTPIAQ